MKFITKSTKVRCVIASAMTALALITLIMLSSLLSISNTSKTIMCFIYTVSLMLILLLWQGWLQIKVFNDYKSQRNYLCADGILSLCMGALLVVSGILFSILQIDKVIEGTIIGTSDIRIFLTCFLLVIAFWKVFVTILSFKEKHFNAWCELLFSVLWFALGIICLITMFVSNLEPLIWVIVSISWALIALNIFYMLFSYVIKTPTYLETEEAINIYNEEIEEERIRKEKIQNKNNPSTSFRLQEKLKKLKDLRDNNLITEEEYNQKKSQLLDTF